MNEEVKEKLLNEFVPEKIGMRIKALRIVAGLSVMELADRVYLGKNAIYRIERGEVIPGVSSLVFLSLALGSEATIDYMLLGRR